MSEDASLFMELRTSGGFRPIEGGVIGVRQGVPVIVSQARNPQRNNVKVLRVTVGTSTPEASQQVVSEIKAGKSELPKILFRGEVPGGVMVDLPAKLIGRPEGLEAVDKVLGVVASVPGAAPVGTQGAELSSVDNVPMFLTATEREIIRQEGAAASTAYDALPAQVGSGIAAGMGGVVVMAAAWAALLAYAELQSWIIAILGGWLISFLATRAAGRVTTQLRVAIFAMIVLGVFLGEILGVALAIHKEFGVFDLGFAFEAYVEFIGDEPFELLFPLAGALLGGYFGMKRAARPEFERQVEVH